MWVCKKFIQDPHEPEPIRNGHMIYVIIIYLSSRIILLILKILKYLWYPQDPMDQANNQMTLLLSYLDLCESCITNHSLQILNKQKLQLSFYFKRIRTLGHFDLLSASVRSHSKYICKNIKFRRYHIIAPSKLHNSVPNYTSLYLKGPDHLPCLGFEIPISCCFFTGSFQCYAVVYSFIFPKKQMSIFLFL